MRIKRKVRNFLDSKDVMMRLIVITLLLTITYLIILGGDLWAHIFVTARRILLPFIIGFTMAYILHPIAVFFEKYRIKRSISVVITIASVFILLGLLFSSILPKLFEDARMFTQSIIDSVQSIYDYYISTSDGPSELVDGIYNEVLKNLNNFATGLPELITGTIFSTVSFFTTGLFSFVIGIYFVFDFETVQNYIARKSFAVSEKLYYSLKVINSALSRYLRSMLVIMFVSFLEYTLVYTLVGHSYAVILGTLTALSLLVPYIGPTIIHVIGIVTGLSLGTTPAIILTGALVVLSQIDGYVISPLIYSKRDKIQPLWALFSFFACSTIFGMFGVFISMPLYFTVDGLIKLKRNNWKPIED